MTNNMIIYQAINAALTPEEQETLVKAANALEGREKYQYADELFHTFQAWKNQGYAVKKGAHAALSVNLWRYTDKPTPADDDTPDDDDTPPDPHYYKKRCYLFSRLQVEKLRK